MNNSTENKSNNQDEGNDEWETDEEETCYFRLSIEHASKIKNEINKFKLYHSKKIKRLDSEEIKTVHEIDKYLSNEVLPNISFKEDLATKKPYVTINNTDFVVTDKPEIGTNLILEINNDKTIKIIGCAERFYEAGIIKPKPRSQQKKKLDKPKEMTNIQPKEKKVFTEQSQKSENKNNNNVKLMNKKRRRKPKRKYIKQSTIIEIKKLDN